MTGVGCTWPFRARSSEKAIKVAMDTNLSNTDPCGRSLQADAHEHLQEITLKKNSVMEMPRPGDDRLCCLRLDRKPVTGALCRDSTSTHSLSSCHPYHRGMHSLTEHLDSPHLLSWPLNSPGGGWPWPSDLEDGETEGQRERVHCQECHAREDVPALKQSAHASSLWCPFIMENLKRVQSNWSRVVSVSWG